MNQLLPQRREVLLLVSGLDLLESSGGSLLLGRCGAVRVAE